MSSWLLLLFGGCRMSVADGEASVINVSLTVPLCAPVCVCVCVCVSM